MYIAQSTHAMTILSDNVMSGVIFTPFKTIRFQEGSIYTTYSIDLSILNYIQNNKKFFKNICPNHNIQFDKMKEIWIASWPETKRSKRSSAIHEIKPYEISILTNEVKNFTNNGCNSLYKIETLFFEIENKCNEIKALSFDYLFQLIGIETLKTNTDLETALLHNKFSTPVSYTNTFIKDFISCAKPKYEFFDNTIFITFEIPYFPNDKFIKMYTIHPKPIIYNNESYIIKTQLKYAIMEKYMNYLYTEDSYQNYCFNTSDYHFCTDNTLIKKSKCEHKYISIDEKQFDKKLFNESCFTKLKKQNKITQVGKQLYFSVLTPMQFYVTQNKIDYIVTLNSSAKIIEEIDYIIKTPYFQFNPDDLPEYKIFESNNIINKDIIFDIENTIKKDSNLIIFGLIAILAAIIIVTCIDLKIMTKKGKTQQPILKRETNTDLPWNYHESLV